MANRLYKRGQTYYAQFYDLNGKRITRTTGCGDRKAAEAKLREFERRAADPDHAAANEATVGQALNNMMRDRRLKGRAQGTLDSYAVKAGHVLRLLGENTVLAQVNARTVDAYIDKRLGEGAKRNTIGKELTVLRGALKVAKRRGEFPRDIAAVMPEGFSTDYKPKERYLPKHEALALLGELAPDRAARVAFIIATGARWGESERAERGDIDLGQQVVRLRGTKTKASARFVPIVGDDARKLLEHAMRYADGSGGLLFRPWGNVRRDLAEACERAHIDPATPNDLRRTTATWLRMAEVEPHLIGAMLGHTDSRMVERVYGRMPVDALGKALRMRVEGPPNAETACSVFVADEGVSQGSESPQTRHAPEPQNQKTPENMRLQGFTAVKKLGLAVPRDGIEPPTRGFSILC